MSIIGLFRRTRPLINCNFNILVFYNFLLFQIRLWSLTPYDYVKNCKGFKSGDRKYVINVGDLAGNISASKVWWLAGRKEYLQFPDKLNVNRELGAMLFGK